MTSPPLWFGTTLVVIIIFFILAYFWFLIKVEKEVKKRMQEYKRLVKRMTSSHRLKSGVSNHSFAQARGESYDEKV